MELFKSRGSVFQPAGSRNGTAGSYYLRGGRRHMSLQAVGWAQRGKGAREKGARGLESG